MRKKHKFEITPTQQREIDRLKKITTDTHWWMDDNGWIVFTFRRRVTIPDYHRQIVWIARGGRITLEPKGRS